MGHPALIKSDCVIENERTPDEEQNVHLFRRAVFENSKLIVKKSD